MEGETADNGGLLRDTLDILRSHVFTFPGQPGSFLVANLNV